MQILDVMPDGHLYSVNHVLPQDLLDLVYSIPWQKLEYQRLQIGNGKRRLISNDYSELSKFHNYALTNISPKIEQLCGIKFTELHKFNITWWVDEPGFRPRIHTDGQLPSAMQVYWLPQDCTDLGTVFYQAADKNIVIYEFTSRPNSGYLMLNSHGDSGKNVDLWHDMSREVPCKTIRLSSYFCFGTYIKL